MRGGEPGLRSMTGFGSARVADHEHRFTVEARTVNHKHLKISARVPDGLLALVPRVEELVRTRITRGTVHLVARQTDVNDAVSYQLDSVLLKRLHGELTRAALDLNVDPPSLGEVAQLPGVVRPLDVSPEADALWPLLERVTREALHELDAMRRREGAGIAEDLLGITERMAALADEITERMPAATVEQGERLRGRVQQLLEGAPGGFSGAPELAREVALLAEKADISEELQRLRSHLAQVRETVRATRGAVGRKLEFLAQELLRETNTMGSKTHDGELMDRILNLKLLVERIREQVLNIE